VDPEVTPAEPVDALADELRRRGIAAPAAILLDAHRPLLPLLRQAAIFLDPIIGSIAGLRFRAVRDGVNDPEAYDRLIDRLAGPPDSDRA
jgi:hypothetical protein